MLIGVVLVVLSLQNFVKCIWIQLQVERILKSCFAVLTVATMPWKAIPFDRSDIRSKLSERFGIQGIPTLLLLDEEHGLYNSEGRASVIMNPNGFPWKK